MKKSLTVPASPRTLYPLLSLGVFAILACTFWFSTVALATNPQCTVCHMNRFTLTLPCQAVGGHLGHGDTIGPCAVTPTQNP
ncbi:MAG: hypothetical protein ABIR71_00945 [Chthoniobacterales bacterium]